MTRGRGNDHSRSKQSGYLLLPVAIAIALIGVLAFYAASQSAVEVNQTAGEFESMQADYVVQAGLQHGLREAAQQGCGPYVDLANVALGNHKYGTSLTTDLGSTTPYTIYVDQDGWIRDDQPAQVNDKDPKLHFRSDGVTERPVYRYDLGKVPPQTPIISAVAHFYVSKAHPEGPIEIRALTRDWTEAGANWDLLGNAMGNDLLAQIPAQPTAGVWVSVNLTPQVQAWVNGALNFGITMNSLGDGAHGDYTSRESANPPYLEIVAGTPPSSPAKLKAVGTIAGGTSRTLLREVTLRQGPASHIVWQHDATLGVDTYIWEWTPTTNYGGDDEVWVAHDSNNDSRSLFKFAIGSLPRGAKIFAATLSLEHESGNDPDVPITAHRITRHWEEDEATWRRRETGINWDTAGGDFDAAIFATTEVGPASGVRYEWDLTGLVQGWVDGTFPNHGVALATELNGAFGERFFSSDETVSTRRPRLSVTYSCQCGITCTAPQGSGGRIVMLGDWGGSLPNPVDVAKESMIESWGYEVDQVDDDFIYTINFDDYDLVYVSETVRAGDVSGQIEWRSIGIVNEEGDLLDNIGFAAGEAYDVGSSVEVVDTSHYITAPFALGNLPIYNGDMELLYGGGALGSGMQPLADFGGIASLMVLDTGAIGVNGAAAGKRVALPVGRFGDTGFDWAQLNANGRLLVQRSIEWAMGGGMPTIGNLLLVVGNDSSLTAQELARKSLFEGWGWAVTVIDEDDNQAAFDAALTDQDVVYVPEDVVAGDLNTKLVNATVGVVSEEANLVDEFGFAETITWASGTDLKVERTHYITSTLPPTAYTILTSPESFAGLGGARAPDLRMIGESAAGISLASLETGASLYGGGNAAARRVLLPWGGNDMDINHLNADGLTILQRSIEWASGAELDLSPLAHWKLDDASGSTAVDSEGGHDGTLTAGPEWASGMLDGGLAFDGVGDYVSVPHDDGLSLTTFSISAWIRPDALSGWQVVVNKGTTTTAVNYYLATNGDEIGFGFYNGGWEEFESTTADLVTDRWYHVAVTYDDATRRGRIYLDGAEIFVGVATVSPVANSDGLTIGRSGFGEYWNGSLDDIQLFDRVLSADEVDALAERPGPNAHWMFDDGSGNTAVDSVGGHDATITTPAWDTGRDGGAIRVQSANQSAIAPHDDNLSFTTGFTLMAWISKASLSGYDGAIVKASTGSDLNYFLGTWFDEIVFGFSTTTDNWQGYYTSGQNLSTGEWDHIAASFDNAYDEVRIYRNGSLVATFPSTLEPLTNSAGVLLGNSAVNELLSGKLDDAQIYNRVLDDAEIQSIHDGYGSDPSAPGYTEVYQGWDATADGVWQTVDLNSFGVPPNAVLEVAVYNDAGGNERWGGVRAVGSTLERRFLLHEAEQGGTDVVTMHVQANASSQIQHYSGNDNDVRFVLLGYWTGASYTELFEALTAGGSNSWEQEGLVAVGANRTAEIVMQNTNSGAERLAGLREIDSSWQRRFNLQEAEGNGVDAATLMVNTDEDAEIEVYAQNSGDVDFHVVGYWSTPPGTYVENGSGLWNPSSSNWETVNLAPAGVPANAVVNVMMTNQNGSRERWMGLRSVGSGENRWLDLHEPESGGADLASIHVIANGSSEIQSYSEAGDTSTRFAPVGWWVLSP